MPDDPRHPHLSENYEHGVAEPVAAPPVAAPQAEDDKPARKPRAAAKKADA